jgi:maleylacetoacetate isomerase
MKLFTYWRSQASYRVRVAMRLKGLPIEKVSLDLLKGDQFAPDYQKLNPEGVVPTLIDGDGPPLVQSLAILEYLEEKYPRRWLRWTCIPSWCRACASISSRT